MGRPRPGGLLGRPGRGVRLVPEVGQGAGRLERALLPVVRRRQDQHRLQLPGPPRADLAAQQARPDLGRRERRPPHVLLPCPQPGSVQVFQRAPQHGRQEGRPGYHLHGPRARAAHRHARLRQDRRGPFRRLRRLLGRGAARADRRQPVDRRDHLRRQLHERQDRRAQEDPRRGDPAGRLGRARHRRTSAPGRTCPWRRAATTGTTT